MSYWGGVGCHCDGVGRVDMEGGINKKWIKAESSEDGIYIHFLDEEKIQVSASVAAVHLTMFVV